MMTLQGSGPTRKPAGNTETGVNPNLIEIMGQSNAAGVGNPASLPAELVGPMDGVYIYNPAFTGPAWEQMIPATNSRGTTGLSGNGSFDAISSVFGVETRIMYNLRNTIRGRNQRLIKYAISNTPLATQGGFLDWNAATGGDELFNRSNANSLAARQKIGDLRSPRFIIWIQGENDASNQTRANAYQANLEAFIAGKRSFYVQPNLPFIIVRNGDVQAGATYPYLSTVRTAQETVAAQSNNYLVSADGLTTGDGIHYDAASLETIAQRTLTVITNNNL